MADLPREKTLDGQDSDIEGTKGLGSKRKESSSSKRLRSAPGISEKDAAHLKPFDKNLKIVNSLSSRLGSGTFGSVFKGYFKDQASGAEIPCAIKVFNGKTLQENREIEGNILQSLAHENIVRVYQIGNHPQDGYYIAMELCEYTLKGFLRKHGIKKFTEREARAFFTEVCKGVAYLQSKNVIHRDLKFENILIDSKNNLKIADFGLAKLIEESELTNTTCGSSHIMAPEIFRRGPYGKAADIWSLGIILYGMLTGDECIYKNVNRAEYEEKMRHFTQLAFPANSELSLQVQDLLHKILTPDPSKRISVEQILAHAWMRPSGEDIYSSTQYLEAYNRAVGAEIELASQLTAQISRDITTALNKTVGNIFSSVSKHAEILRALDNSALENCCFGEALLYGCIRIVCLLNKLESLEWVGTNKISTRLPLFKLLDQNRQEQYKELKARLLENITVLMEKLDVKKRKASSSDRDFLEAITRTVDAVILLDMKKETQADVLKGLYKACLSLMALCTKDYDQFVVEIKPLGDSLVAFAEKHNLEAESLKGKVEAFVNQLSLNLDSSEQVPARKFANQEIKGMYEISFRVTSVHRQHYDQIDKILKDVETRIEPRVREL